MGTLTRREFFMRVTGARFAADAGDGTGDCFPDIENLATCHMGDLPGQEPLDPLFVMYMDRRRVPRSLRVTRFTEEVLNKILGKIKREIQARERRQARRTA